jgi:hypothetical protein
LGKALWPLSPAFSACSYCQRTWYWPLSISTLASITAAIRSWYALGMRCQTASQFQRPERWQYTPLGTLRGEGVLMAGGE